MGRTLRNKIFTTDQSIKPDVELEMPGGATQNREAPDEKKKTLESSDKLKNTRRILVTLSEDNYEELKKKSDRTGVSISSIIAMAVDHEIRREKRLDGTLYKDGDFEL